MVRRTTEEELSPGLFIERRSVLTGIAGMFLCMIPAARAFAAADDEISAALSFEQFLAQANPLAKGLVEDASWELSV